MRQTERLRRRYHEVVRIGALYGFELAGGTGSGHLKLVHPVAGMVVTSATPSDVRTLRNLARDLKRRLRESRGS